MEILLDNRENAKYITVSETELMIITSIPAGHLIRILSKHNYEREYQVVCFFLVRQITGKKLLLDLYREIASFDSLSSNMMLLVLFYGDPNSYDAIRETREDLWKTDPEMMERLHYHHCRELKMRLTIEMASWEKPGEGSEHSIYKLLNPHYETGTQEHFKGYFDDDYYLKSMTQQTDELKRALELSEDDLPCLAFIDRKTGEVSLLHCHSEDDVLVIYQAIRTLVVRNLERGWKREKLAEKLEKKRERLQELSKRKDMSPRGIEQFREDLAALESQFASMPEPEPIDSLLTEIERNRKFRTRAKKLIKGVRTAEKLFLRVLKVFG
ncbi:MAG: hypothetical protein ABII79_13665 [bacterium]